MEGTTLRNQHLTTLRNQHLTTLRNQHLKGLTISRMFNYLDLKKYGRDCDGKQGVLIAIFSLFNILFPVYSNESKHVT